MNEQNQINLFGAVLRIVIPAVAKFKLDPKTGARCPGRKVLVQLGACALLLGMWKPAIAQTQQPAEPTSLGELARKLRAERARENQKPVAVFTNDNLPGGPAAPAESEKAAQAAKLSKAAGEPAKSAGKHDEKYFRSRAEALRSQMELHQRELNVLQQKLGVGSTGYNPNPQKTLEQESTPAFYSDQNKLRSEIDAKEQQIVDDQKALDDLRDELRHDGGDPGWIR